MNTVTFETLPQAVSQLYAKLESIEQLLRSNDASLKEDEDQLLTVEQTAEFLNLKVPTIYGLVSRSAIPYSKPGKCLYFSKKELTAWVKESRRKTKSEIATEAQDYISNGRK